MMDSIAAKRIMILAPHTDDGELGCGGTIARFLESGSEVFYTAFSVCEESLRVGFPSDTLEKELRDAMAIFGIPETNLFVHRYPVRHLLEHRQAILQDIVDMRDRIDPDLVYMPCLGDIHQDHQVVAAEGLRAYRERTILSYELPKNNIEFRASAFVTLDERHVERKIEALACYRSQANRPYTDPDFIRSLARIRGVQIQVRFAEAFELVRLIL